MNKVNVFFLCWCVFSLFYCSGEPEDAMRPEEPELPIPEDTSFLRGADLSYVNQMLDCGAVYYNFEHTQADPYKIFGEAKTDLARFRLWHKPDWTDYSNMEDVKIGIVKARAAGMQILLDFHYSDDWADPSHQTVPAAWRGVVNNTPLLADSMYNYTYRVLEQLNKAGLLPEFVQVGNEINIEILQDPDQDYIGINWPRNTELINSGLKAVREAAKAFDAEIQIMLHIAQPENALWWFKQATNNGVTDFDWIALSYYPKWSDYGLPELPGAIKQLKSTYGKEVLVVETAYPYTFENADAAGNILGEDALIPGFPATEVGQYEFLESLEDRIIEGGGRGLVYWEPAWVSTTCSTRWGKGSHWDNATLFDQNKRPLKGLTYFSN